MRQFENNTTAEHYAMSTKLFFIWAFIIIGRPQDYLTFLVPFRLALVFTGLVLITTYMEKRIDIPSLIRQSKVNKRYFIFYIIMWLGVPLAAHRFVTFHFLYKGYFINVLFFYLFFVHIDSINKLKRLMMLLCLACFLYGVFTLAFGRSFGGRISIGSMFDPNDLAHYIVTLFPMSLVFLRSDVKKMVRMMALMTFLVAPLTVFLTGSRGGFLALFGVVVLVYLQKIEGLKKSWKIGFAVLACLAIIPFAHRINTERFTSMTNMENDYNFTSDTGRKEVWKTGLKLILHNPVLGVGGANFGRAFGNMRGSEGRVPVWKTAHNSFIQLCAEVGIIGFWIFMSIIYLNLKGLRKIAKIRSGTPFQLELKKLSAIVFIGYIGNLIGAFFLSQAYSILFTLYFAMSAKIEDLSEQEITDEDPEATQENLLQGRAA